MTDEDVKEAKFRFGDVDWTLRDAPALDAKPGAVVDFEAKVLFDRAVGNRVIDHRSQNIGLAAIWIALFRDTGLRLEPVDIFDRSGTRRETIDCCESRVSGEFRVPDEPGQYYVGFQIMSTMVESLPRDMWPSEDPGRYQPAVIGLAPLTVE